MLGLWGSQYGFYTNGWLEYYSADNNWHLINGKSTGTETLYFNGAFRKTINSGSGRPYRLAINGGGMYAEYSDSSTAEIIIFDKVLTDSERIQINYYLANKWNLLGKIDSDGDGFIDSIEVATNSDPTNSHILLNLISYGTETFKYTGKNQTYKIKSGTLALKIELWGAGGGTGGRIGYPKGVSGGYVEVQLFSKQ